MRQVFSSPRLANVEGIAKMLEGEGIEVRITHGRSYKSAWSGRRTYRDEEAGGPLPAVWVVKSEDQPRARQLLRQAGLLDSTRGGSDSFLPDSLHAGDGQVRAAPPTRRAFRYKIGLIIAIVVAVALAWMSAHRMKTAPPTTAATAATTATNASATVAPPPPQATHTAPPAEPVPNAYPVDTPPARATTLAGVELATHTATVACLRIDGAPAPPDTLKALPRTPRMDCTNTDDPRVLVLDVRDYRTDGSGTGTVDLAVTSADAQGRASTQVRTLLVRRTEAAWRVLRVLSVR